PEDLIGRRDLVIVEAVQGGVAAGRGALRRLAGAGGGGHLFYPLGGYRALSGRRGPFGPVDGALERFDFLVARDERDIADDLLVDRRLDLRVLEYDALERAVVVNPRHLEAMVELLDQCGGQTRLTFAQRADLRIHVKESA